MMIDRVHDIIYKKEKLNNYIYSIIYI